MTRLLLALSLLAGCSTPVPTWHVGVLAQGTGLALCAALPEPQRTAARPVVALLVTLADTNVTTLLAQLEAVPADDPGHTVGTGQIWQAIHATFAVDSVAADYGRIAVGAVKGCAVGLGA